MFCVFSVRGAAQHQPDRPEAARHPRSRDQSVLLQVQRPHLRQDGEVGNHDHAGVRAQHRAGMPCLSIVLFRIVHLFYHFLTVFSSKRIAKCTIICLTRGESYRRICQSVGFNYRLGKKHSCAICCRKRTPGSASPTY